MAVDHRGFFCWQYVAYLLLHIWGLRDESESLLRTVVDGIAIGGVKIVVGKLLIGMLLFIVLLTFTRWLRRKLEVDWLVKAGVEASTRDAAATLFGYVTFLIAALTAPPVPAGVDLSKLAIVAGALSVGIGFGLQNIVSNFVSGLILLFERPVRTGDYINVDGSEGIVRRMPTSAPPRSRPAIARPSSCRTRTCCRTRCAISVVWIIWFPY
ncbi:MAG: mechanosensitive ion channel [Aquabacterium sp.]